MAGPSRPGITTTIPGPLVDAAVRGFAAGYDATSVRQIAADAGLDPAVVGRSFKTKGQLFTEVAAAVIGPVEALAAVAEGPPDRAGERLLGYFRALLADEARSPRHCMPTSQNSAPPWRPASWSASRSRGMRSGLPRSRQPIPASWSPGSCPF